MKSNRLFSDKFIISFIVALMTLFSVASASPLQQAKMDRLIVYGDQFMFGVKEPGGWQGDTEHAATFMVNMLLYPRGPLPANLEGVIRVRVNKKANENTAEDLAVDMDGYRKRFADLCDKGKMGGMIKRKWTEKSSKIPMKIAGQNLVGEPAILESGQANARRCPGSSSSRCSQELGMRSRTRTCAVLLLPFAGKLFHQRCLDFLYFQESLPLAHQQVIHKALPKTIIDQIIFNEDHSVHTGLYSIIGK